jgi:integrase
LAYLYDHASSYEDYRRIYRKYFASWRDHPTMLQVRKWHRAVEAKGQANKGLGFLSAMYNWASYEEDPNNPDVTLWRDGNPTKGVKRNPGGERERVLNNLELARLLSSLEFYESEKFHALVILLLTTGARLGDALTARWEHVNLETGEWFKPTTKNGHEQRLLLPLQTREKLRPFKGQTPWNPHVFAGWRHSHWSDASAEKFWSAECIRKKEGQAIIYPSFRESIGLHDVRIHDFRRTVATRIEEQTGNRSLVKAILNHRTKDVTDRYIRVQFDRIGRELQTHADRLFAMLEPSLSAPSVTTQPIPREAVLEAALS